MFFYTTQRVSVNTDMPGAGSFDPMRCNSTKCYIDHYQNYLALDHISKYGEIKERYQANQELAICKRKMAYWERQPHFNKEEALRQRALLHKRQRCV